jgi:hypothetical protein
MWKTYWHKWEFSIPFTFKFDPTCSNWISWLQHCETQHQAIKGPCLMNTIIWENIGFTQDSLKWNTLSYNPTVFINPKTTQLIESIERRDILSPFDIIEYTDRLQVDTVLMDSSETIATDWYLILCRTHLNPNYNRFKTPKTIDSHSYTQLFNRCT